MLTSSTGRLWRLVPALLFFGFFLPVLALGQSDAISISKEVAQNQRELRRVEELQRRVLEFPRDEKAWSELLDLLEGAPFRESFLEHFRRRRDWVSRSTPPEDLKTTAEILLFDWTAAAATALPSSPSLRWRLLSLQTGGEMHPSDAEALQEAFPDNPQVAYCLAQGWAERESPDRGLQHLTDWLASHPRDPRGYQALIGFQRDWEMEEGARANIKKRAEVFPEDPRFRVAWLEAMAEAFPGDLSDALGAALRSSRGELERMAICQVQQDFGDFSEAEACYRGSWSRMQEHRPDGEPAEESQRILEAIFDYAAGTVRDISWALEILAVQRGEAALSNWDELLVEDGDFLDEVCEAFDFTFARGDFDVVIEEQNVAELRWVSLPEMLQTCGRESSSRELWKTVLSSLSGPDLGHLAWAHKEARRELLQRFTKGPVGADLLQALYENQEYLPALDREKLLRLRTVTDPTTEAHLEWAIYLKNQGRYQESEKALQKALSQDSSRPDLYLALAAVALEAGHDEKALAAAEALRRQREATPRQVATAHYVFGRVARRAGKMEDATTHFERYFLQHFEFAGCCDRGLDAGFVAHLRETEPEEHLAAYLEAKKEALAKFATASTPRGPFASCATDLCELFDDPHPGRNKLFEFLAEKNPDNEAVQERVAPIRALRNRWRTEDPETLFEDEKILFFDPTSLGRSFSMTITTSCGMFVTLQPQLFESPFDPSDPTCPW